MGALILGFALDSPFNVQGLEVKLNVLLEEERYCIVEAAIERGLVMTVAGRGEGYTSSWT
jgi:hypothetical protein